MLRSTMLPVSSRGVLGLAMKVDVAQLIGGGSEGWPLVDKGKAGVFMPRQSVHCRIGTEFITGA